MMKNLLVLLALFFQTTLIAIPGFSQAPPPDSAARIVTENGLISVMYGDRLVFSGRITESTADYFVNQFREDDDGRVTCIVKFTAMKGKSVTLSGTVTGSENALACEAERRIDGPLVVRHASGPSHSLLNRAVYDRDADWLLSVDHFVAVRIDPAADNSGGEIILRFRPHYYQVHRGLKYFEPWTYSIWQKPVVGWCSWFAYWNKVTEADIRLAADVLSKKLKPYGLEYLQIDDGYQQDPIGVPAHWLTPNAKFPSGMTAMAEYITKKGLKPGIWTNVSFHDRDFAFQHKDYFVLDEKGDPAWGRWVGYVMDGSDTSTMNDLILPVYRGFREGGWSYFKVDALRHLRYEGYNSYAAWFSARQLDREKVFRDVVAGIRGEIGRDRFMMGCWGIRPELAGLIDGCRIGDDGYGYDGLAQFNSFNNVVWLNDPDHIELTETEAYRSCTATSLTGSLFMLTDKPEKYTTEFIEPAVRSIPVLFTLPGQVYDVDPTRSDELHRVNSELSGSGQRVFDASRSATCDLYLLEVSRSFENWMLLGRLGTLESEISFSDLGLDGEKEYLVFEFWTKTYTGSFTKGFRFGKIPERINCQLFCIRERTGHPQLLATSRHLSCGALEVMDVLWSHNILTGTARPGVPEPYTAWFFEPDGYNLVSLKCKGAAVKENHKTGNIRVVTFRTSGKEITWELVYQ
jgi:alpha-galactosidase